MCSHDNVSESSNSEIKKVSEPRVVLQTTQDKGGSDQGTPATLEAFDGALLIEKASCEQQGQQNIEQQGQHNIA